KNTYDSTNSQKSKESSKVKTLIRTIPISIALASALSSHAVAAWQFGSLQASGSGLPSSTGTISGEDLIVDGLTIDLRNYWVGINNYLYGVARNGTGGNLTINNNSKIEVYKMSGPLIKIDGNATAGIITNNGIINRDDTGTSSVRATVDVGTNASVEAFINTGTIYWEEATSIVRLWGNSSIGTIKNTGIMQSRGGIIIANGKTIGSIEFDGGLIQRITNAGTATNNAVATTGNVIEITSSNIGTITMSNSASIHGNISLSGTRITD
ncbi:hypothetical protein, partial [Helicobacter pullorum]|uniref:hypothetical protein n=1 Tax=Helicobacter pullorum TaxID=35818 RepID=UPI000B152EFC